MVTEAQLTATQQDTYRQDIEQLNKERAEWLKRPFQDPRGTPLPAEIALEKKYGAEGKAIAESSLSERQALMQKIERQEDIARKEAVEDFKKRYGKTGKTYAQAREEVIAEQSQQFQQRLYDIQTGKTSIPTSQGMMTGAPALRYMEQTGQITIADEATRRAIAQPAIGKEPIESATLYSDEKPFLTMSGALYEKYKPELEKQEKEKQAKIEALGFGALKGGEGNIVFPEGLTLSAKEMQKQSLLQKIGSGAKTYVTLPFTLGGKIEEKITSTTIPFLHKIGEKKGITYEKLASRVVTNLGLPSAEKIIAKTENKAIKSALLSYEGIRGAGVSFVKGGIKGAVEHPVKTIATGATFFILPALLPAKGIAGALGIAKTSKLVTIGKPAIETGLAGLYAGTGAFRLVTTPAGQRAEKAGEMFSTEVAPAIIGSQIGGKFFGRLKAEPFYSKSARAKAEAKKLVPETTFVSTARKAGIEIETPKEIIPEYLVEAQAKTKIGKAELKQALTGEFLIGRKLTSGKGLLSVEKGKGITEISKIKAETITKDILFGQKVVKPQVTLVEETPIKRIKVEKGKTITEEILGAQPRKTAGISLAKKIYKSKQGVAFEIRGIQLSKKSLSKIKGVSLVSLKQPEFMQRIKPEVKVEVSKKPEQNIREVLLSEPPVGGAPEKPEVKVEVSKPIIATRNLFGGRTEQILQPKGISASKAAKDIGKNIKQIFEPKIEEKLKIEKGKLYREAKVQRIKGTKTELGTQTKAIRIIKPTLGFIGGKEITRTKLILKSIAQPAQKIFIKEKQRTIITPNLKQIITPKIRESYLTRTSIKTVSALETPPAYPTTTPKVIIEPPIGVPAWLPRPSMQPVIGGVSKGRVRQPKRYTPSLTAIIGNIRGKAIKGTLTGIEIRPIASNNVFRERRMGIKESQYAFKFGRKRKRKAR